MTWGPIDAIATRPTDNVPVIQHALTALQRARMPPAPPVAKSVPPAAPATELELRRLTGPRPLLANGIRNMLARALAPLASLIVICTGSLLTRERSSSLRPAPVSL